MRPNRCPVCLRGDARVLDVHGRAQVDCQVCGLFRITSEAWADELDPQVGTGSKLTALHRARLGHLIRSSASKGAIPSIDSAFVQNFVAGGHRGPTPAEQVINLVRLIGDHVTQTGTPFAADEATPVTIGAFDAASLYHLFRQLSEKRVLFNTGNIERKSLAGGNETIAAWDLTLDGWEKYQLERRGLAAGNYGFLAMQFGEDNLDNLANDIIRPRVKTALGYDIVDMRQVARAGLIDNIMRQHIRDSAFVVVDLTHDNSGAYWEAGYAEGLGKPVIYICETKKFKKAKTHFDTNHCTTVLWSRNEQDKFATDLIATLRRSLNLFSEGG